MLTMHSHVQQPVCTSSGACSLHAGHFWLTIVLLQWQRRKPKTCESCEGSGKSSCSFCNGTGQSLGGAAAAAAALAKQYLKLKDPCCRRDEGGRPTVLLIDRGVQRLPGVQAQGGHLSEDCSSLYWISQVTDASEKSRGRSSARTAREPAFVRDGCHKSQNDLLRL